MHVFPGICDNSPTMRESESCGGDQSRIGQGPATATPTAGRKHEHQARAPSESPPARQTTHQTTPRDTDTDGPRDKGQGYLRGSPPFNKKTLQKLNRYGLYNKSKQ